MVYGTPIYTHNNLTHPSGAMIMMVIKAYSVPIPICGFGVKLVAVIALSFMPYFYFWLVNNYLKQNCVHCVSVIGAITSQHLYRNTSI